MQRGRPKGNENSWKRSKFRTPQYSILYKGHFYDYRRRSYFRNLSNISGDVRWIQIEEDETESFEDPCNETEFITCAGKEQALQIANGEQPHMFKTQQEAEKSSTLFLKYLFTKSTQLDTPWIYFKPQEKKTFEILTTPISSTLGAFNLITLMVVIFAFTIFSRQPGNQLENLLQLIQAILPPQYANIFPNSLFKFDKFFNIIETPAYTIYKYSCEGVMKKTHTIGNGTFILYDISSVVSLKLKSSRFCILFSRSKSGTRLSTITDGRIIQTLRKMLNVLYSITALSYGIFVDGISCFKSSSTSLYPIYLVINEMKIEDRYKLNNMILIGLLVQKTKPQYCTILIELVKMMQKQFIHGFRFKFEQNEIIIKGLITNLLIDMGERGNCLNTNQGGYFGCSACENMGRLIGNSIYYPDLRSPKQFLEQGNRASELIQQNPAMCVNVKGVLGYSVFSLLPFFPVPRATTIDPMHTYALGVAKDLLEYWISKEHENCPYFLTETDIEILNKRIQQIQIPHSDASRLPREISVKSLSQFKAYEFQSWLIHYGCIVLKGLLPKQYLLNFKKLCLGLKLLWKPNLTFEIAIRAHRYIVDFLQEAKQLYGCKLLTIKFHSLLHATTNVLDYGPLREFSCMHGEHLNGSLIRQLFGTHNFLNQVVNRFTYITMLNVIAECVLDGRGRRLRGTKAGELLEKFGVFDKGETKLWKEAKGEYSGKLFYKVSHHHVIELQNDIYCQLEKLISPQKLNTLKILKLDKIKLGTRSFNIKEVDNNRRSSSFCTYQHKGQTFVGQIRGLLHCIEPYKFFAILHMICPTKNNKNYYKVTNDSNTFHVIPILDILDQMMVVKIDQSTYLSEIQGITFCLDPHPDDSNYPLTREQKELEEFFFEQMDIWIK